MTNSPVLIINNKVYDSNAHLFLKYCQTLANMCNDNDDIGQIPITHEYATENVMKFIEQFLVEFDKEEIDPNSESIEFDKFMHLFNYWKAYEGTLDKSTDLYKYVTLADFLNCHIFIRFWVKFLCGIINDLDTVEKIREKFAIRNDFDDPE